MKYAFSLVRLWNARKFYLARDETVEKRTSLCGWTAYKKHVTRDHLWTDVWGTGDLCWNIKMIPNLISAALFLYAVQIVKRLEANVWFVSRTDWTVCLWSSSPPPAALVQRAAIFLWSKKLNDHFKQSQMTEKDSANKHVKNKSSSFSVHPANHAQLCHVPSGICLCSSELNSIPTDQM